MSQHWVLLFMSKAYKKSQQRAKSNRNSVATSRSIIQKCDLMLAPCKERAVCHSSLQIAYTKMVLLDPSPIHENKVTQPLETQFTCCVSVVWLLPDANTMLFYFPTSKTMSSFSNLTSKPEWGESQGSMPSWRALGN